MKHFIFFDGKNTERTVKDAARDIMKQNPHTPTSLALNAASIAANNGVAFNKAVAKSKPTSPFTVLKSEDPSLANDTLFLPIELTSDVHGVECDAIYYVPVTNKCAALSLDYNIPLQEQDDFVKSLQWRNLERIDNECIKGWVVNLYQPHSNEFVANIEVKCTSEGIILDLWSELCGEFIESTTIEYTDLFEIGVFSEITKSLNDISDYEACIEIGVDDEDGSQTLITAGGLTLTLNGSWTVIDDNGDFITPIDFHTIGYSANELNELTQWLHGKYSEHFKSYECISSPWFSIDLDSNPVCDAFSSIPRSLNGCLYLMAQHFIN